MTAPRRMALAFYCMLLAVAFFPPLAMIPLAFHFGYRFALSSLQFLPMYSILGLPGWLSAVPFVLLFPDAKGWRLWTTLAIGSFLGPLLIFTWCTLTAVGFSWQTDGSAIVMSFGLGLLTAALYVALLRRFARNPLTKTFGNPR